MQVYSLWDVATFGAMIVLPVVLCVMVYHWKTWEDE